MIKMKERAKEDEEYIWSRKEAQAMKETELMNACCLVRINPSPKIWYDTVILLTQAINTPTSILDRRITQIKFLIVE